MKIVWSNSAIDDLARLREFIQPHNTKAAKNAADLLIEAINKLKEHPRIGKPVTELHEYREYNVRFGVAGYVIRYRIRENTTYILHIRHYRESAFKPKSHTVHEPPPVEYILNR